MSTPILWSGEEGHDEGGEAPILDADIIAGFVTAGSIPLRELAGEFVKRFGENLQRNVVSLADADGLWFACPKCFIANRGLRGTHYVLCWAPHVPLDVPPGPGRWNLVGTSLDDVELVAGSSSVLLKSGCQWHGFVRGGAATLA